MIPFRLATACALLGAVILVHGDGLAGLPSCAATCVNNAVFLSPCNNTDVSCLCASNKVVNTIACCIPSSCTPEDQTATIHYFSGFCQQANVTLTSKDLECPTLPSQTVSATPSSSNPPKILGPSADLSTKAKVGIIAGSSGAGVLLLLLLCLFARQIAQSKKMRSEINQLKMGGYSDPSNYTAPMPPLVEMAMPTPELESAKLDINHQVQDLYSPGTEICYAPPQSHSPQAQTYLQTGRPRPVHELQTWGTSPVHQHYPGAI